MSRVFYSGTKNASSWALRAWLALRESDVAFEEVVVDIRRPQRFENLAKVGEFSPPKAVPVLVDEETVIFDSLAIMEYANEIGKGDLLPADPKLRARTRSLYSWQHSGLSGICPKLSYESYFYPEKRRVTDSEIADAERLFDVWEQELKSSGGPFLTGALSLADLAFVPTILRLTAHFHDLEDWPLTKAWIAKVLSRDSVLEWLSEAVSLPPVLLDEYWS